MLRDKYREKNLKQLQSQLNPHKMLIFKKVQSFLFFLCFCSTSSRKRDFCFWFRNVSALFIFLSRHNLFRVVYSNKLPWFVAVHTEAISISPWSHCIVCTYTCMIYLVLSPLFVCLFILTLFTRLLTGAMLLPLLFLFAQSGYYFSYNLRSSWRSNFNF